MPEETTTSNAGYRPPTAQELHEEIGKITGRIHKVDTATPEQQLRLLQAESLAAITGHLDSTVRALKPALEALATAAGNKAQEPVQGAKIEEARGLARMAIAAVEEQQLRERSVQQLATGDPAGATARFVGPCIVLDETERDNLLATLAGLADALQEAGA
jgi:hypothetical protein